MSYFDGVTGRAFEKFEVVEVDRKRVMKNAVRLNVLAVIVGAILSFTWKWYGLPLVFAGSVVLGMIYTSVMAVVIRKRHDLTVEEQLYIHRAAHRASRDNKMTTGQKQQ